MRVSKWGNRRVEHRIFALAGGASKKPSWVAFPFAVGKGGPLVGFAPFTFPITCQQLTSTRSS